MKYHIYCDESRHTGGIGCRHAVIGGVWIPDEHRASINKDITQIKEDLNIKSELKWSKVSSLKLGPYKEILNYFWSNKNISFRSIIIDQEKVKYNTFHDGDKELGFYKFYYEMLEKWLLPGNQYNILLDFKKNSERSRLPDLEKVLKNYGSTRGVTINSINSIDSSQSNISQLCDILTGAVAASANAHTPGDAKKSFINHLEDKRGTSPISTPSASPSFCKFNIFKINLG